MPPLRAPIKFALVGAFWTLFLLGYFTRFPVPGFLRLGAALTWAAAAAGAAFGWGVWPLGRLWRGNSDRRPLEIVLLSSGLGWGVLSLAMMLLGGLQGWTPLGARLLILAGLGLGFLYYFKNHFKINYLSGEWKRWLWLIAPLGLLSFLLALAPVTYYDSLVYHLALPAAYIRAGHWVGWQDLVYSAFPQNLEMLWTLGLLIGGPALPNLIAWLIAMTLAAAVGAWGYRFLDARSGMAAAALLLAMPVFLFLSSGGYVDVGLAFYVFLSVYALSLDAFVLAGLFAGLAIGVKYTGGMAAVIGGLWILGDQRRGNTLQIRLRNAVLYAGAALGVFAPWLAKNFYYTGNPVFPFLYTWGKQDMSPWMSAGAAGYFRGLVEYEPHALWELPKLLWSIAADGIHFGGGSDILGDFGWAPLVALLPLTALAKTRPPILRKISLYAGLFFVGWGLSRPVLRFLVPAAPLLALIAGYGWAQGLDPLPRALRWAGRTGIGVLGLSSFLIFFQIADVFQPFRVPLRLQTSADYLKEKLTYYGAAAFINENADPRASVVIVGDQRSYYYERRVRVWTVFNRNPVVDWADAAASPRGLRERLRGQGELLLVNRAEMRRLAPYHALDFSAVGQKNWEAMLHDLKPVYRDAYCDVYLL